MLLLLLLQHPDCDHITNLVPLLKDSTMDMAILLCYHIENHIRIMLGWEDEQQEQLVKVLLKCILSV